MVQAKSVLPLSGHSSEKILPRISYFDAALQKSSFDLKEQLLVLLKSHHLYDREFVLLCIGSDRSTGDSLGPIVGYKLEKYHLSNVTIYGTLNEPVHAANLAEKLEYINLQHKNPFVLAIDASLGTKEHIGYVTLCDGPLKPGLGVNKTLPNVGDIHITGIVNFSGMMESLLLQTTRLSKVMQLADMIAKAVLYGITEYYN
ncbi:MAG: spore protease YyaC [Butyrivibrio sp.]